MKVAMYRLSDGCELLLEADDYRERSENYIRTTEIAEVTLEPLAPEIVVPALIAQIDNAEAELRNRFNEKLSELNAARANLLALTHQVTP
jgi:hypothetical protein